MALMITTACSNCEACEPVCPNQAIGRGDMVFAIDAFRCTECVGAEAEPQCMLVCAENCIVKNPDFVENSEELQAKYQALHS